MHDYLVSVLYSLDEDLVSGKTKRSLYGNKVVHFTYFQNLKINPITCYTSWGIIKGWNFLFLFFTHKFLVGVRSKSGEHLLEAIF